MVVRVQHVVAALLDAQMLERAVGDHLVGVHVGRGAGAALDHVDDELRRAARRAIRSSQARTIAPARLRSITPSSAFACAAAFLTQASARTRSRHGRDGWPVIGKFSTARARVHAPVGVGGDVLGAEEVAFAAGRRVGEIAVIVWRLRPCGRRPDGRALYGPTLAAIGQCRLFGAVMHLLHSRCGETPELGQRGRSRRNSHSACAPRLGVARRSRAARGRCAPPSSSSQAAAGGARAPAACALQLLLHRAGRQEGQAVAFERHRLQALGHVGLVDRIEVQRRVRLLERSARPAGPGRRPTRSSGTARSRRRAPAGWNIGWPSASALAYGASVSWPRLSIS